MTAVAKEIAWREAGLADIEALCTLVNQSYRPPVGWEGWLHQADYFSGDYIDAAAMAALLQRGTVIITHRGQQILGAVGLHFDDNNKAFTNFLAVPAPCQSLGLGRFLLYRAEVLARAGMASALQLPLLRDQLEVASCLLERGFDVAVQALAPEHWPWAGEMIKPVEVVVLEKKLSGTSLFDGPNSW